MLVHRLHQEKDLQRTIEKEAKEYDNANREERILGGDRGSVDDTSDDN